MSKVPPSWVLWSDELLLVVNKPAGVSTTAGGYGNGPHLFSYLEPAFGQLWLVHRLDRETSGVLVLARTPDAHRALNTQFQERRVHKVYHALVEGSPSWQEQTIDLPLRPDGDRRHRTVVVLADEGPQGGKPSSTYIRVLEQLGPYALLEAVPKTGRAHQIRAHLSALHLPIVGDTLYGGRPALLLSAIKPGYRAGKGPERPLLERVALHAFTLTIEHPGTHQPMSFEAPYPKELAVALRQLRKWTHSPAR